MDCDECGFDYETVPAASVPGRLRDEARVLAAAVAGDVRVRPAPDVWSPLEYACHVRDMLDVQLDRVELALREACPTFVPMGREERVVDDRYNEQDVDVVRVEVVRSADALADRLDSLSPDELARTGIYTYPEPTERTIAWVGVHTVHELVHHTLDISRR